MAFDLPPLPYAKDALSPHISAETLDFHHGKHHQAYVTKLNAAVDGTPYAELDLVAAVKKAHQEGNKPVFNNGAQHFNHSFYWKCLSPKGGGTPKGALAQAIDKSFGNFDAFKKAFGDEATNHFASGWAWLARGSGGELKIMGGHDADTPLVHGLTPILTCDVWEHAYYIDYRNARPKYVEAFWNLVNWDFAAENLG
jgi:Fe-Mn family superoxide dismutase